MRFSMTTSDLGPIGNAKVDIAPLTVFVGDNNTGKTTLARMAMAVFGCFSPVTCRLKELLTEEDEARFVQDLHAGGGEFQMPVWLIEKVADHITSSLGRREGFDARFRRHIAEEFGAATLRSLRRSRCSHDPRVEAAVPLPHTGVRTILSTQETITDSPLHDLFAAEVRASLSEPLTVGLSKNAPFAALSGAFRDRLASILPKTAFASSYYLPVTQESNFWHSSLRGDKHELTYRKIKDWSDGLNGFFEDDYGPDCVDTYALSALREVMGGKIMFEPASEGTDGDHIDFVGQHGTIPLSKASSVAQRLAPLYLLLAYRLEAGDMLVVESPEALMDPDRARALARALVHIANAGTTVLLTTQSPYVLEEIAECMRLSLSMGAETQSAGIAPADVTVHQFSRADVQAPVDVARIEADDMDGTYKIEALSGRAG